MLAGAGGEDFGSDQFRSKSILATHVLAIESMEGRSNLGEQKREPFARPTTIATYLGCDRSGERHPGLPLAMTAIGMT